MKKRIVLGTVALACCLAGMQPQTKLTVNAVATKSYAKPFTYEVNRQTMALEMKVGNEKVAVTKPLGEKVTNFTVANGVTSWTMHDGNLQVSVKKVNDHVEVTMTAQKQDEITFPQAAGKAYYLPFGEGKYIEAGNKPWQQFLTDYEGDMNELLSMPFIANEHKTFASLFIWNQRYNNDVSFETKGTLSWKINHLFPRTNPKQTYQFSIYPVGKSANEIAKQYRHLLVSEKRFTTLTEKAKKNPNIKKLYGAPHIYLWDKEVLVADNIRWQKLRGKLTLLDRLQTLNNKELSAVVRNVLADGFFDQYEKRTIVDGLNEWMTKQGLERGKAELARAFGDVVAPMSEWGNGLSVPVLKAMKEAGIDRAWLGLSDWTPGLMNKQAVQTANDLGYLIAPYDSYHSIHEKPDPAWLTASFDNPKLFEEATVTLRNGKKRTGFLGRGRTLNSYLVLDEAKKRVNGILRQKVAFNSWFIDCDAAGELFDDYTPGRMLTQQQEWIGRQKRLAFIRDEKKLIIGSELGIDYAARDIAFAHGLETPVIAWSDKDMRENEQSPYYVGKYWSATGGAPSRFVKQVPLKKVYRTIYLDETYTIPLYKLVYNDSVITTHHWEFGSLKLRDEVEQQMLHELLYNVPPLYHIDRAQWTEHGKAMTRHAKVFAQFHKEAVQKEMTSYRVLSADRHVQMATFGNDQAVVANFGTKPFVYEKKTIPARSALLFQNGKATIYTPTK